MYPKWGFKKEGRIGSFGYTFYLNLWAEKRGKIKPKNGENFGTKSGIIFVPASINAALLFGPSAFMHLSSRFWKKPKVLITNTIQLKHLRIISM